MITIDTATTTYITTIIHITIEQIPTSMVVLVITELHLPILATETHRVSKGFRVLFRHTLSLLSLVISPTQDRITRSQTAMDKRDPIVHTTTDFVAR